MYSGSQVQCYARAVNTAGEPGRERGSHIATIHKSAGVCQNNLLGQCRYSASLSYIGISIFFLSQYTSTGFL